MLGKVYTIEVSSHQKSEALFDLNVEGHQAMSLLCNKKTWHTQYTQLYIQLINTNALHISIPFLLYVFPSFTFHMILPKLYLNSLVFHAIFLSFPDTHMRYVYMQIRIN